MITERQPAGAAVSSQQKTWLPKKRVVEVRRFVLPVLVAFFICGIASAQDLGLRVYKKLQRYCPECKPFILGAATSEPKLALVVPFKFWANLSTKQKYALCDYMYHLVNDVKLNPADYLTDTERKICYFNPKALLCELLYNASTGLEKGDWEILLGVYKKPKVFLDISLVCGDTSEYCRGVKYPEVKKIKNAPLFYSRKYILHKRTEFLKYHTNHPK